MTSEGMGEVFEVDSADTCTGKYPLMSMGGRANGQACADGEQGPPSARAEFFFFLINHLIKSLKKTKRSLKTLITDDKKIENMCVNMFKHECKYFCKHE